MPRRRVLTSAQLEALLALPLAEPNLVRRWTLSTADLAAIRRRRRDCNRIGFALQLCALRYPGRLLRPGECIPDQALRFVAGQLGAAPEALATYAARFQTRYEQLDALREAFGFADLSPTHRRGVLEWLLPVALATTSPAAIATALMDELRRRAPIVPGPSIVEQLVAGAMVLADRHVARQLTRRLSLPQAAALDALLAHREGLIVSTLAWARQPPGPPRHRALSNLVEQLACLRAVGLDPTAAEGVHSERHRRYRAVEHRLPRPRRRRPSPFRRDRAGCAARAPRPARVAARQPHRRLPLEQRSQRRRAGRVHGAPQQDRSRSASLITRTARLSVDPDPFYGVPPTRLSNQGS